MLCCFNIHGQSVLNNIQEKSNKILAPSVDFKEIEIENISKNVRKGIVDDPRMKDEIEILRNELKNLKLEILKNTKTKSEEKDLKKELDKLKSEKADLENLLE